MTVLDKILASIIAALLLMFGIVLIMNANLRADVAQARANVSVLTAANADFKNSTEKQNQAIQALKAAGDARLAAVQKAMKRASAEATQYRTQAAVIANIKSEGDDCAGARVVLGNYLQGYRK
jgi:hypothetical protein